MRYLAQNTPHGWWVLTISKSGKQKVMAQRLTESEALAKLTELRETRS